MKQYKKHSTNNTRHLLQVHILPELPHTCQNTHTLQNPHIHTPTCCKTHTYTHPHITKLTHTDPHITKQVKTTTVQDTHQMK
jgi:hypothetical protein